MKVSREQAVQNRERIVATAAQLFRERGFEGIGVADLMKEAGLTHGGFYGHFASKDDLIAEASTRVLTGSLAVFGKVAERAPADALP
ncbi:MAG: TetR/AcrR family transcriptional regulator, partial [Gemmatimonadaceae bacterium]